MNDTERYLKQATRGLWGKEKQALRTELMGHIRIRTSELMLGGFSEQEAERQTLRELGAPQEVSRGMAGVYAAQTAVKGTLMTALLSAVALVTVQQGQAQVKTVYDTPDFKFGATAFLDFDELNKELQKSGGQITGTHPSLILKLPGTPRPDFPLYTDQYNLFSKEGKTYLSLFSFFISLQNTGAQVSVTGWNKPTITAGQSKIQVKTQDWRVMNVMYHLTLPTVSSLTAWGTVPMTNYEPNGAVNQVSLSHKSIKKGHIYALVVPRFGMWSMTTGTEKTSGTIQLFTNIVQATQNGQAQFRAAALPIQLVNDEEALHRALDPYLGKMSYWSAKNPAPALLLELSGKSGEDAYKVLPLK